MTDVVSALLLLGVGGLVGASAAVVATGSQVAADFAAFKLAYRDFMAHKIDGPALDAAFKELDSAIGAFGSAFARLRRALAIRR